MVVVVYLAIMLLLYLAQSKMIYFPSKYLDRTPGNLNLDYEDIDFTTEDGIKLHGWYVPSNSARSTVLFCHGNAGNISHRLESIQQFHELGLNVFIFDYRGYGRSQGKITEEGTYRDATAAWRYLTGERRVSRDSIIIFGRSLGGAVATWLAAAQQPALLIVESSFTSIADAAAYHYPYIPARWLVRFNYDSEENIKRVRAPILIIHSHDDEIVPYRHGQALFEAAHQPKQFLEISGSHNDGFLISSPIYEAGIRHFLDVHLDH